MLDLILYIPEDPHPFSYRFTIDDIGIFRQKWTLLSTVHPSSPCLCAEIVLPVNRERCLCL